ncbi:MAG: response regulator [Deltaproteobacteria bacterium]|nr:response regulator [Deltaproteobacteria bacterium]
MKEQPLILLVDDDPVILELIQEILRPGSYTVEVARNGREAVERLQGCSYDLVLTDMVMPEMQGLDLLQYVRLHHPETLTIVFTGYANYQDAVAAVKLGAFDYLTKPLRAEILRHAIDRALEFRRLTRAQHDLELIFQGAESLGWQALELVSDTPEAAVLAALQEEVRPEQDLKETGRRFLEASRRLVGASHGSIFLFDPSSGLFSGLAALGPNQEYRAGLEVPASSGIMGYLATHPRPLLVSDMRQESRFPMIPPRAGYHSASFMIIPLLGRKFWGVINLTEREGAESFTSRDLFLGWLLGRLLVEILETRKAPQPSEQFTSPAVWVQEQVPVALAILDENLKIVQANPALERLLGFEEKKLAGKEFFPNLGLDHRQQLDLEEAFRSALAGGEAREFFSLKAHPNGTSELFLGVKVVPMPGEKGSSRGLVLMEDMSELEHLRQRLQLFEHLAIMGKLSLCVAHELNNPLDGVHRYLSLALMKKDQPQEVERYLLEAQKGLQKMASSIKSLMFSANPLKQSRPRDNLLKLLQDAVKIMMFQASDQKVQVSLNPPRKLQQVIMDGDLYHVFLNIIKNALQAMPQGGHLHISGHLHPEEVEITFEDTGAGLSPQELEQIFQPFYSTKEGAKGLGLGLPICQKIVERHGGRLMVTSRLQKGTKVSIFLPQAVHKEGHDH